jgi:conjugative relaxase-like TrwC/TraI family protein
MMSIAKVGVGNADYYESRIGRSPEGYYTGRGDRPGVYFGQLAERLEAEGEALPGALKRLLDGQHPLDGAALRRPVAETSSGHVGGFDLTLSCPKDVSIHALVGPAEQRAAVNDIVSTVAEETVAAMAHSAGWSRRGRGGATKSFTGELGGIRYVHPDSRAHDPNLHMHFIVANMQCVDGKWLTLDGRPLYSMVKAHGMLFQAMLRAECARELGWGFDDLTPDGQATLSGFPAELRELFSKRRSQVLRESRRRQDEYTDETGRELGGKALTKLNAHAVLTTRARKGEPVDLDDREAAWIQEAAEAGFNLAELRNCYGASGPRAAIVPDEVVAMAIGKLSADKPSWKVGDAMQAVLAELPVVAAESSGDVVDIVTRLTDRVLDDFSVIEGGQPYEVVGTEAQYPMRPHTTVSTIVTEQQAIATVLNSEGRGNGLLNRSEVSEAAIGELGDGEQADAVTNVATDGNGVSLVRAPAGSGKTRLWTLASCYSEAGWNVVGLAPSAAAAEILHQEAEIERSSTLTKLLVENEHEAGPMRDYRLDRQTLVILDEASLASTRDTANLIALAKQAGSKLVLVGDDEQLQSVEAGGLFTVLCQHFDTNELSEVRRMSAQWEREASTGLRQGDADALDQYIDHGRVRSGTAEDALDWAYERWADVRNRGGSLMVMARTNGQLDDFNERARAHLRDTGELKGPDVPIGNLDIAIGDELVTRRNARWIVTTNKSRVINGARWEVTRIRHDGALDVTSLDGRGRATLPADYTMADDQLSYGYGSTVHRAQGSTVDQAIFLADEGASRNLLYVAASRARERNDIWLTREGSQATSESTTLTDEDVDVLRQVLKRTDQEATGSEVVWAKELGYELDDDRIHQLLTPAGRLAIQSRAIRLEHGVRERNAGADGARSAVVQAQKDAETARGAVDRADSDLDRAQKRLSVEEAQGLVARVRGRHDIADVRLDVAKKSEDSDFAADALEAAAQRLTEAEASYDGALEVTSTANRRDLAIIDSLKQRLMLDDRGHQAAAGAGRISATAGNGNQSAGGTDWSPEHIAYANELQRRSRQAVHQPVPPFEQPGVSRGM